jgi:hypothetical protein
LVAGRDVIGLRNVQLGAMSRRLADVGPLAHGGIELATPLPAVAFLTVVKSRCPGRRLHAVAIKRRPVSVGPPVVKLAASPPSLARSYLSRRTLDAIRALRGRGRAWTGI